MERLIAAAAGLAVSLSPAVAADATSPRAAPNPLRSEAVCMSAAARARRRWLIRSAHRSMAMRSAPRRCLPVCRRATTGRRRTPMSFLASRPTSARWTPTRPIPALPYRVMPLSADIITEDDKWHALSTRGSQSRGFRYGTDGCAETLRASMPVQVRGDEDEG